MYTLGDSAPASLSTPPNKFQSFMSKTNPNISNNNLNTNTLNSTDISKNNDKKIGGGIMKEKSQMSMHTDESHKTHFMNTLKAARGDNHGRKSVIIIIHL
jgi:hypothetical protein